jgi:hypothetical protein
MPPDSSPAAFLFWRFAKPEISQLLELIGWRAARKTASAVALWAYHLLIIGGDLKLLGLVFAQPKQRPAMLERNMGLLKTSNQEAV